MEMAGCCRVTTGGGGGGGRGRPEVTALPTMFMSFLAAGSSISTGLVWTESSEGTKPRLSIKLGGMGPQSTEQQFLIMLL